MRFPLFLVAALALPAAAQEMVHVSARPGTTQAFFIAAMEAPPRAAAILLPGGEGMLRLRREDGRIRFAAGNFLTRSRAEFARHGILPVLVDAPSDRPAGMDRAFRESPQHALDLGAVVAEVKRRHPGIPVFLVGTSASTVSVAHAPRFLKGELAGGVLSASLFRSNSVKAARPILSGFDWASAGLPLLFVHHLDDACAATPYFEARRLAARYPLVSVHGGAPAKSGPCEPFSPHGFYGKERETVEAIALWMLGKDFRRDLQ